MSAPLEIGSELQGPVKVITMEAMRRYSGGSGIHSDEEAGKAQGLGGALMQGGQLVGYLNQLMTIHFGLDYLNGGNISASFVRPVRDGDTITPKAIVRELQPEGYKVRVVCEVWLENQKGEKATVGTASSPRSS